MLRAKERIKIIFTDFEMVCVNCLLLKVIDPSWGLIWTKRRGKGWLLGFCLGLGSQSVPNDLWSYFISGTWCRHFRKAEVRLCCRDDVCLAFIFFLFQSLHLEQCSVHHLPYRVRYMMTLQPEIGVWELLSETHVMCGIPSTCLEVHDGCKMLHFCLESNFIFTFF